MIPNSETTTLGANRAQLPQSLEKVVLVLSCIISYSTISKKQRSDDLIIFNDARGTETDIVE